MSFATMQQRPGASEGHAAEEEAPPVLVHKELKKPKRNQSCHF